MIKPRHLSPHFYALSSMGTTLAAFFFFRRYDLMEAYFFVPMFVLALIYAAGNLWRQYRGRGEFSRERRVQLNWLLWRAFVRYLVWLAVFSIAYAFFANHPFYSSRQVARSLDFIGFYYRLYIVIGLPYFMLTLLFKASRVEDFYDPAIRILLMLRHLARRVLSRGGKRRSLPVLRKAYNRKVLLNLLMRAYFVPTMVVQVYFNLSDAIRFSAQGFNHYDLAMILFWLSSILWMSDAMLAAMSYGIESRWLENRSRSVDLTVSGWLICLSCYAPLNMVTSTLFPFGLAAVDNNPASMLIPSDAFYYAVRILENVVLLALIYSDAALGPSIANISLKKIQDRGPFAIVRHPVYAMKLLLWWVQVIFYRKFWTFGYVFGQLMWNVIYILRALTEERHLRKFAGYREYMQKVRYRFIPWLF